MFEYERTAAEAETSEVKKVSFVSMIVNLVLSVSKFAGGISGGSQALVADGIHSLSDWTTDLIMYFGVKYWTKPPDEDHPYGHRKIESLITGLIGVLLAGAGITIAYRSVENFLNGDRHTPGFIPLVIAVISIFSKELLFRWSLKKAEKFKSSSLEANAWHHRSDGLSSIPVALAIIGGLIDDRLYFLDMIGAFIVAFMILEASWSIIVPVFYEMTDAAVEKEILDKINELICNVGEIKDFHALRTRRVSSHIYADFHIMVDGDISVRKGHEIAGKLKHEILASVPDVSDILIHIEPFEQKTD